MNYTGYTSDLYLGAGGTGHIPSGPLKHVEGLRANNTAGITVQPR